MTDRVEKERADIPEPDAVVVDGVRYEAVQWGRARGLPQNGGYIAAFDDASGRELWLLKVYDVVYDGDKEGDKQDVFIASMSGDRGQLRVTDERGRNYNVDTRSRAVTPA